MPVATAYGRPRQPPEVDRRRVPGGVEVEHHGGHRHVATVGAQAVDLLRGGLGDVRVATQEVAHLPVEALPDAGALGHDRSGPGGLRHQPFQQCVVEAVVLVERPQVAHT